MGAAAAKLRNGHKSNHGSIAEHICKRCAHSLFYKRVDLSQVVGECYECVQCANLWIHTHGASEKQ